MIIAIWFIGIMMIWMFTLVSFDVKGYWYKETVFLTIVIWSIIILGYWLIMNFGNIIL